MCHKPVYINQRPAQAMNLPTSEAYVSRAAHTSIEHDDEPALPSDKRGGTLAIAASFFALFCVVGLALWGLPFYYDFMVQQFGWSRAQVTSGNALSKFVIGPLFGFFAGWMVDRFGPRRLMIAGILMAAGALVGLGSVSTLPWFYLFYMVNALGYVCGGPLPSQVAVSQWFLKSRGKAMGLAYLGVGFGGAASPWISHFLVTRVGWHSALQITGILIVVLALPFALLMKEVPRSGAVQNRDTKADVRKAFRTLSMAFLIVGSMCSIAAVSGTQQNLKLFLSLDRHYSQGAAAEILSLVLGFSIVGRVVMGWMADRFSKRYVMLTIYLLVAGAIPFLFLGRSPAIMFAAAAMFGIGLGGDYMIIPLMTAEIFGVEILGRLMGVLLAAGGIADALSPWWIGHLRDSSGSYQSGCYTLVGMALLGAVAVIALPKTEKAS